MTTMTKEILIAMGLTEEQAQKVITEHNKTISDSYITKARFNEVNNSKKDLEKQLSDRDKQLTELGEKAKGNEALQTQIQELQAANKTAKENYEKQLSEQAFNFALDKGLSASGAKNPKVLKGLLDMEKLSLEGDAIKGLEDQIKAIKESDGYLFGEVPGDKGANPGGGGGSKLTLAQQYEEAKKANNIKEMVRIKQEAFSKNEPI